MHIGVVNAALAAIDDQLPGADTALGSTVNRLHFIMTEKPPSKTPRRRKAHSNSDTQSSARMNPAFDSWLENKLHNMFDAVAAEPLPPDLVKLLEQLDQKTQGSKDDKKGED